MSTYTTVSDAAHKAQHPIPVNTNKRIHISITMIYPPIVVYYILKFLFLL